MSRRNQQLACSFCWELAAYAAVCGGGGSDAAVRYRAGTVLRRAAVELSSIACTERVFAYGPGYMMAGRDTRVLCALLCNHAHLTQQ